MSQNGLFWADYSLNMVNTLSLTAKALGQGVCASPELNLNQLREFPDLSGAACLWRNSIDGFSNLCII